MSFLPGLSTLVDSNGNYLASTVGAAPPTTNALGNTTSKVAAVLQGCIGPTGLVVAQSCDASGASVTRSPLDVTMAFSPATQVNTGTTAGKSMLSLYNAGTYYQRVLGFEAMCPPQAGVTGGLLTTTSSYTTIGVGVYKMTSAHSGGTLIAGAIHDTRDTYDSNFTCRTGATISNQAANPLYVFDAANSAINAYGRREDATAKLWTMAPNEGITFNCLSTIASPGVNFYLRVVTTQAIV